MPGHASAAIASYPSLGCDPQQPINVPGKLNPNVKNKFQVFNNFIFQGRLLLTRL